MNPSPDYISSFVIPQNVPFFLFFSVAHFSTHHTVVQCLVDAAAPNATERIPFSFAAFSQTPDNVSNDFGTWAVDELQICDMSPNIPYVLVLSRLSCTDDSFV